MNKKSCVIWDWNGTLLNDVIYGVEIMNRMLSRRGLSTINLDTYREIFGFPVKDYYSNLGFNVKDEWEIVANEFIRDYHEIMPQMSLFPEVKNTLEFARKLGLRQSILSAMEHETLNRQVADLGIREYFDFVEGISDHYAGGKTGIADNLTKNLGIPSQQLIFIGDTLHDADVARHIGCDCVLVANGHQSITKLGASGMPVVPSMSELYPYFNNGVKND